MLSRTPLALRLTLTVVAVCALMPASAALAQPLALDLRTVPLSHHGSYMTLAHLGATDSRAEGLYVRSVRGSLDHQSMLRIEVRKGDAAVPVREVASPSGVGLEAAGGSVAIVFDGPDSIRLKSTGGLNVRVHVVYLRAADDVSPAGAGRFMLNVASNGIKFMFDGVHGRLNVQRATAPRGIAFTLEPEAGGDTAELAIDEFFSSWKPPARRAPFEQLGPRVADAVARWRQQLPQAPAPLRAGADLAAFLLWSNRVAPRLLLSRPAIFSTKNTLIGDWGWDHVFHALPLAAGNPDAAWDEFMVVLDAQDAFGAVPDRLNDTMRAFSFVKPPVQGWGLRKMMTANPKAFRTPARMREAFSHLAQLTNWWFTYRDEDGDGLPEYHHGNDSGWDNATPFLEGVPVESPDLAAYLVVQMDVLADLAKRLGNAKESATWKRRADSLLSKMMAAFWRGDRFQARLANKDEGVAHDSLLMWIPMILGERLPANARKHLVAGLSRFVTPHGVATEAPNSPQYEGDGYWRGPVWGPSTLLIVDGLQACGAHQLARQVAEATCKALLPTSMPENFDALTGAPRKDTAFSWTSAAFLILARDLVDP